MPQNQLNPILFAVRLLFSRFCGTLPNLTDISPIVLMSRQPFGCRFFLILF